MDETLSVQGFSRDDTVIRIFRLSAPAAVFAALFLISLASARAAGNVSANDTARFLAGLKPSPSSPLAKLTRAGGWIHHARTMDAAWKRLQKNQLNPIRAWSKKNIPGTRKQMLYMFSGPDFLYANAFFPDAETYVLSALEPVGPMPNMLRYSPGARAGALYELRGSMQTVLSYSFFITKQMKSDMREGNMRGTLPVLFVFLARAGNTINAVEFITLTPDGLAVPRGKPGARTGSPGVRIAFTGSGGKLRNLYYFQTDLSNGGLKRSGLRAFSQALGPADSLIKSASYLLHSGNFTLSRDFLLKNSRIIVQDDSGIPLRFFARDKWELHPFGKYLGPIDIFPKRYQNGMKALFARGRAKPIKFGIGYRWRTHETNVLLGVRKTP
ncbi:hypothetical protein BMS3Bbin10_02141 [bacterium BMS3Bbin10]|nr:hypothetical protein BMS3Bbin10_02141 [bacterium BMS3Bbin10]